MSFIQKQPERNGRVSVHLATSVYVPGKKHPKHIRQYLGVLDTSSNELLLSSKSPEPDTKLLKLLKVKGIAYNGKHADGRGPKPKHGASCRRTGAEIETPSSYGKGLSVMEIGRTEALRRLGEGSGLLKALSVGFGEIDGARLLTLAMHQVCEGEALYLAENWIEDTGAETLGMSPSSVCRIMSLIGGDHAGQQEFFRAWIKACGTPTALIHDTTSISTYAANLESAEWGYNRDCEAMPQVNLALVVGQESRLPLWFRLLPGSIPDVTTLKITSQILLDLGLERFSYSLDRGYFSSSNMTAMLGSNLDFTIGVPLGNSQAKALLKQHHKALRSVKRAFLYGDERLRHVECQFRATTPDGKVKLLPGHLYLNPERQEQSLKGIEISILQLEKKAKEIEFADRNGAVRWIQENAGALSPYLSAHSSNGKIGIKRKSNAMAKLANKLGITLLISTDAKAGRENVMANYRARDLAEKVFDSYKNATGNNRLRSGQDDASQGRVFLGFIAVVLRSLFEQQLRGKDILKRYSVPEALALLKKIKQIKLASGKEVLLEVPKKTREVAIAFGVPVV
jgi:transposase